MKRVDRILSNALGESHKNNSNCKENKDYMDFTLPTDMNITLASDINLSLPSIMDISLLSQVAMINENDSRPVESPVTNGIELPYDIESPMAPLFSPLTPLVSKRKQESNFQSEPKQDNSSPIRPMSPCTFELYQTLIERGSPFQEVSDTRNENYSATVTNSEISCNHLDKNEIYEQQDQVSDFSCDTDSDYIPNSDEDLSDAEMPESRKSKKISVVAVVHCSEENSKKSNIERPTSINDSNMDELTTLNEEVTTSVGPNNITNDNTEYESMNENYNNQSNSSRGRLKKGRKRKYEEYTLHQKKERKYANLPYQGKSKLVKTKLFRNYICSCSKRCHELISAEKRQEEFETYVALGSYEAQLLFIKNCVKETPKTRSYTVVGNNKTGKTKPKEFKRTYTIGSFVVCRDMFINNFQITTKKVDVCLRKMRDGKCINDRRGLSVGGWNKTQADDVEFIKSLINSLPKYESHYRREQNSGSQYLKLGMTIQKIYDLYVEKCKETYGEEKAPVSLSMVKHIFRTNFNLRCKGLKKDTCSRCDTFNNKIKNSNGEEQAKLNEAKIEHLKRAEDLRNLMKDDLIKAKTDESFECLTFDLEKTLPLPRIPTSIVFYKRQLWLYNCGIHSGSDDIGHCYIWIEGEAGRGSQEVGSCLIKHIEKKLDPKVQHLLLWSDCCGGQNRNIKIVLMLKALLNSHETLKSITLKYLESGHTFLPNDTDFSKIETQLKFHERLYTADQYINVIKSCKKKNPLQVTRMEKNDFLSVKKIEKNIVNRKILTCKAKVNWLQTKQILIRKEDKYSIFMKTISDEHFQELNIKKKIKGKTLDLSRRDFEPLWPNGKDIPEAKLEDLKSMFDLIPKDCLPFYKSLRGNTNLQDDFEGFGGEPDFNIEMEEIE